MAPTGSLIPASIDMHGVLGADFAAVVQVFADVAQTLPFDLTGYTVTLTIGGGILVLTSGSGLTITAGTGSIAVAITAAQTLNIPNAQHYNVKLVDGAGAASYVIYGTLTILTP